jgi:hypothetical protein
MRDLLTRCGIALLTALVWTVTSGAAGRGPHGPPLRGGLVGHMKRGGGHAAERMRIFFPVEPAQTFMDQLPGEPGLAPAYVGVLPGGPVVAGAEHMIAAHLMGPPIHQVAHLAHGVERAEDVTSQAAAAAAAATDDQRAATAQPNPLTAGPLPSRPPGASGPGLPVSGLWGPGLPGPGRPPSQRR